MTTTAAQPETARYESERLPHPGVATAHDAYLARRFFESLDGLRCLAIVAVICHHTLDDVPGIPLTGRGFLGVDLFFALSGFLIVTLLLRERERSGTISLTGFYRRRSLRIFPLYFGLFGVLAFVFGVLMPGSRMSEPFFHYLPYHLTFISDWVQDVSLLSITWSLAAEEQFYLLWPPIERWFRDRAIALLLLLIAANQAINFGWWGRQWDLNILRITFTPICLGVLLAHVLHSRFGFARVARVVGARWASPVLLGAVVLAANIPVRDISGWPRLLIQVLMVLLLASCVVREDHILAIPLRWAPIRRIGVMSYGMYLFHMFARHGADALLNRTGVHFPAATFLVCLGLTVVAAELSFRLYETPFLRLKDALGRGKSHPAHEGGES
jgi:peptidoglycan/LPS O-acetylase OafA/YrhL